MKLLSKQKCDDAQDTLRQRRELLSQSVTSVVQGFTPSLFVWGPPGLGKTHELTLLLDGLTGRRWKHHTAYATPKGLMLAIAETPNGVHLFEDCESMLKTALSASILRAACGSPNDRDRIVTYETNAEKYAVKFTGGIIIATNENLARASGPMQGVASRFRPVKWDMTAEERIAMLMQISDMPHVKRGVTITAHEARKVLTELLSILDELGGDVPLDLRLFTEHALPAFAQSKMDSKMKWQDMLAAKLTGTAQTMQEGQAQRTARLRTIAQRIHMDGGTVKDRVKKWEELTGLGQAIYYRHVKGMRQGK